MKKKFPLLIVVLLLLPFFSQGQQLQVSGFLEAQGDISARVSPKLDQNGKECAMIKINTALTGLDFDCAMGFEHAIDYRAGEVRMYVSPNERMLKISLTGAETLEYILPMTLKSLTVYKFTLRKTGGTSGVVNINTSPEGADVYLDGSSESSGKTPLVLQISEGNHSCEIQLAGYRSETESFVLEAGVPKQISKTLQETQSEFLMISSEPDNAEVYINGEFVDYTPLSKMYSEGSYSYKITKPFYKDATGTHTVIAGETNSINETLIPNFGGLTIKTSPVQGARIYIDGSEITGKTTPHTIAQLSVGEHTVKVSKSKYRPASQKVNITSGTTKEITIKLDATFAEININCQPSSTRIKIDGANEGTGSYSGNLGAGIHTAELSKEGYTSQKVTFTVVAGQAQQLDYTLIAKTGNIAINSKPLQADIYLNGENTNKKSPSILRKLKVGNYKIELKKEGFAASSQTITVSENKTANADFSLQSGLEVTINSQPQGATLYINGQSKGKCPQTLSLNFGNHNIKLSGIAKHKETAHTINIQQGGKTNYNLSLNSEAPEGFVFVKGGTFQMGNLDKTVTNGGDERPIHSVTVSDFYIGKYEVTQKQWEEVMYRNKSSFKGDNLPVEKVSWNDIQKFIKKLNKKTGKTYRLPTEAEWEFAARGGTNSKGYKYAGSNNIDDVAWYSSNSGSKTHKVGTKQANELGIYDMSGNVWEWCSDWYGSSYYKNSPSNNPQGATSGSNRVYRGGGWSCSASYCRVANRRSSSPTNRISNLGFRLALRP